MFSRSLFLLLLIATLPITASAQAAPSTLDAPLREAAQRLKVKDYRGATDLARTAKDCPEKELLCGVAALRLEQWPEAIDLLGQAARDLPLLTDYALEWQAEALFAAARYDEALVAVSKVLQNWSDGPLARKAYRLKSDILFARGDYRTALGGYLKFVELYPSGSDSIASLYQIALCYKELGEQRQAVQELRTLWLLYPASPVAAQAEEMLDMLAKQGVAATPYTSDELFKRASTLYNLGRYDKAVEALNRIPRQDGATDFNTRLDLKTGQAQYRARRFRDALQTFGSLLDRQLKTSFHDEACFWQAKALDRTGQQDQAIIVYLALAGSTPPSELADDALLEIAYIDKFRGRYLDELKTLETILSRYPTTRLKPRIQWEDAWARYNTKDYRGAAAYFQLVASSAEYREKALYWQGRALKEAGEADSAAQCFTALAEEFPVSFYTFQLRAAGNGKEAGLIAALREPLASLALPGGYERTKALMNIGLWDEARKELALAVRKIPRHPKTLQGVARLYLEMDDYAAAAALFRSGPPRSFDSDTLLTWNILYPRAFHQTVAQQSSEQGVPEELIYAIIKAESSFSPKVVSPAGAVGLMQIMPATAKSLSKERESAAVRARLTEPQFNIRLGVKHLLDLLNRYNGNVVSAIAAYNAGATPVDRWRNKLTYDQEDEFIENIPYYETREYVKKVLTGARLYRFLYDDLSKSPLGVLAPPASSPPLPVPAAGPGSREEKISRNNTPH